LGQRAGGNAASGRHRGTGAGGSGQRAGGRRTYAETRPAEHTVLRL